MKDQNDDEYAEQPLNEPETWTDEDQDDYDDYQQSLEDRAMDER